MSLVIIVLVAAVALLVIQTVVARRAGYKVGGAAVVRCSKGHLFTTTWVPGVSFKAIRLGLVRYQHCPVGHHWALVRPVKEADLTDEERRIASENRDSKVP